MSKKDPAWLDKRRRRSGQVYAEISDGICVVLAPTRKKAKKARKGSQSWIVVTCMVRGSRGFRRPARKAKRMSNRSWDGQRRKKRKPLAAPIGRFDPRQLTDEELDGIEVPWISVPGSSLGLAAPGAA